MGKMEVLGCFAILAVFAAEINGLPNIRNIHTNHLSKEEIIAVGKLRDLLQKEITAEFMSGDYYLANFLRRTDLNVDAAAMLLRQYLLVRAALKLDTILLEDWTEMRARFPYSQKTADKHGQPITYFDLGDWNICGILKEGATSITHFYRFLFMFYEDSMTSVRKLQAEGKNVKYFRLIINGASYDTEKHGCAQHKTMLGLGFNTLSQYSSADSLEKIVIVYTPLLSKSFFTSLGSETIRKWGRFYGQDKTQWEADLLKEIDLDQFPEELLSRQPVEPDNSDGLLSW